MKYVRVDSSDGRYHVLPLDSFEEIEAWRACGATVVELSDEVWARLDAHMTADALWQHWFLLHSNAQYALREPRDPDIVNWWSHELPNPAGPEYLPTRHDDCTREES